MRLLLALVASLPLVAFADGAATTTTDTTAPKIVDKPITFDDERKALTIAYRQAHTDDGVDDVTITPRMIILHYTGGHTFEGTWNYFNQVHADTGRKKLKDAGDLQVSSHFVVDRDGTIYRLVPETTMARHCIGLNHVAIGVENVGDGDKYPLTDAQVDADAALVRYLAAKYPIEYLIGHHEYRRFEGTDLFREKDPNYRNRKPDPGDAFMTKVRAKVADLGLKGPPDEPKSKKTRKTKKKGGGSGT